MKFSEEIIERLEDCLDDYKQAREKILKSGDFERGYVKEKRLYNGICYAMRRSGRFPRDTYEIGKLVAEISRVNEITTERDMYFYRIPRDIYNFEDYIFSFDFRIKCIENFLTAYRQEHPKKKRKWFEFFGLGVAGHIVSPIVSGYEPKTYTPDSYFINKKRQK